MGIGTGALIAGGIGAIGSIAGSAISANASQTAAQEQAASADKALQFNQQVFDTNQRNIQPYLQTGSTSTSKLMSAISGGQFGPGSNPSFQAPTAAEVQATPGYQFTQDQGTQAVLQRANALGLSGSGGTAKDLAKYTAGLADSTYNNRYNEALAAYSANLQKQSQEYNQLLAPTQLGESAAVGSGSNSNVTANNASNLMTSIGNAQAAGTVGSANAVNAGISGVTQAIPNALLYNQFAPSAASATASNPNASYLNPTGNVIAGPQNPNGFYAGGS